MNGTPPIPETSVSGFVWMLGGLTALVVVLTLLVVRRRHHLVLSLTVGLTVVLVVGAGALYLIAPPEVPAGTRPAQALPVRSVRCPYDRMVWSNMRSDVDATWQPCRRASRTQLVMALLGMAAVTLAVANVGLQLTQPGERPASARTTFKKVEAG